MRPLRYPRANTMLLDNVPSSAELRVMQAISILTIIGRPFFLVHVAMIANVSRSGLNEILNRLRAKEMVYRSRPGEFHILPKGAGFVVPK